MIFKSNIASSEKFGRQANAQQPQSSGITSSEKMNHLPKWPMVPLMILLALCTAKHANAQVDNYISVTNGSTNVYPYVTPPNIAVGATFNNFFGTLSGLNITIGNQNSIFGPNTGVNLTSGSNNTFIGGETGANSNGNSNTYVGFNSGVGDYTGTYNTALGQGSGFGATGLTDATAIGYNATASNSDEMVFGDGNVTAWGFGMDVTTPGAYFQLNLGGGSNIWMNYMGVWASSDRRLKENFEELDNNDILQKVMALPITKWSYISDKDHLRYVGPMAQDFFATFKLGSDSTHINAQLTSNIALAAIKALGKQTQDLKAQNSSLTSQVQGLTSQNQALEETVTGLQAQNAQFQNSVSDLQDQLNTVLAEIENLKTLQAQCCSSMGVNVQTGSNGDNGGSGQASLAQNAPNPFSQNTVISYYLPANIPNAVITVRALTGAMLKSFNITAPGAGSVTVNAGALAPGTYEYDMIANNQIIDSKKMVIMGQ